MAISFQSCQNFSSPSDSSALFACWVIRVNMNYFNSKYSITGILKVFFRELTDCPSKSYEHGHLSITTTQSAAAIPTKCYTQNSKLRFSIWIRGLVRVATRDRAKYSETCFAYTTHLTLISSQICIWWMAIPPGSGEDDSPGIEPPSGFIVVLLRFIVDSLSSLVSKSN